MRSQLEAGEFTVTAEIVPLKGTDTSGIREAARILKGRVAAANVTDQQSAVMKLGALAACHLALDAGLEIVFEVVTRDRNRIALESDLLSAAVLGLENVLAITGDLPSFGDHPQAKLVYDVDSVQLLEMIKTLNGGHDMVGNELQGTPDFFAGAVVNPGADSEASFELQIIKMAKKIEAGARFFQTQAVFDVRLFEKFMKRVEQEGFKVPVLVGLIPLKNAGMARYMNKNVSGIFVPQDIIDRMAGADDKVKTSIEITAGLLKEMKDMCQGAHLMTLGWDRYVPAILKASGL
ncbi:MAG: methylenetetrahydrofolate reductase [Dehalococcoidales bacterium]|nr:methylenetetrahydrofolate reductase [Dehalococcoidales bacterium]